MSDTFTEKEMKQVAEYVQKKERMIMALNTSVQNLGGPTSIYGAALNEILIMVYEDRLPGALNLQKSIPDLYPALKKPEKKEGGEPVEE